MATVKTLEYVETGEIRAPRAGEWFRGCKGFPERARFDFNVQHFPILKEVLSEVTE